MLLSADHSISPIPILGFGFCGSLFKLGIRCCAPVCVCVCVCVCSVCVVFVCGHMNHRITWFWGIGLHSSLFLQSTDVKPCSCARVCSI